MASLATNARPPPSVKHPKHPEHRLTLAAKGHAKFECDGCHEHGTGGNRYACQQPGCCFNLHEDCALTELGARFVHELLKNTTFEFCFEAPRSSADRRLCDACGARVLGFHYHCSKEDLDLHPCCAKLPPVIQKEELTFELRKEASHRCKKCKGGGGVMDSWFYRSTCKTEYLHVRCVKEVFLPRPGTESGSGVHEVDGPASALPPGCNLERAYKILEIVLRIAAAISGGPVMPVVADLLPGVVGLLSNSTG